MPRPHGAVNLLTLVLLLIVGAAGYLGWIFIPPWLDNLDVREATTATFNRMATDPDDGRIRAYLLGRANHVGSHWESRGGTWVELPGLGLTDRNLVLERDNTDRTARVRVDYQREVRFKPTDHFQTLDFFAEKAGKLPQ